MQQSVTTNINSKYFVDRLENDIVQLTKALSIELRLPIEEAKLSARQIIQRRLNQLLTKEEKEGIEKLIAHTKNEIKSGANQVLYGGWVYELLKTMELL